MGTTANACSPLLQPKGLSERNEATGKAERHLIGYQQPLRPDHGDPPEAPVQCRQDPPKNVNKLRSESCCRFCHEELYFHFYFAWIKLTPFTQAHFSFRSPQWIFILLCNWHFSDPTASLWILLFCLLVRFSVMFSAHSDGERKISVFSAIVLKGSRDKTRFFNSPPHWRCP